MFTISQHRAFLCGGFAWTMHVECVGPKLNDRGELAGVDYGEFWQWITDHITAVPGNDGTLLTPQQDGALQVEGLGAALSVDADSITAPRMAFVLLPAFRDLSDMVRAVKVLRTRLGGHPYDTVECIARVEDTEPMTVGEFTEALRRFAVVNQLVLGDGSRPHG